MKTKTALLLIFATLTPFAPTYAREGGVGNGGVAHVCRDPETGTVTAIELLDLRRGKKAGYTYNAENLISDSGIVPARAGEIIYDRLIAHPAAYERIGERLGSFTDGLIKIEYVDVVSLFWTGDGEPGEADPGCRFEQLGIFQNGILYINTTLYRELSHLDRLAFFLHESVYSIAKEQAGATNSVESQKLVGMLLSLQATRSEIAAQIKRMFPKMTGNGGVGNLDRTTKLVKTTGGFALIDSRPVRYKIASENSVGHCQIDLSGNGFSYTIFSQHLVPGAVFEQILPFETKSIFQTAPVVQIKSFCGWFRIELWQGDNLKAFWSDGNAPGGTIYSNATTNVIKLVQDFPNE